MRPPVLHVIPALWSGAGNVVTRLCIAQRQHGPVTIVTSGATGPHADWSRYRAALTRAGVEYRAIDFFHRDQPQFWTSVIELETLIRRVRPAVIHAHAGVPACGAAIAQAASGHAARAIGQMYSWGPDRPEWMNRQDTWGLGQMDKVVCSARTYWDLLVDYGVPKRKLIYLPWGLPLERLPPRGEASASTGKARPGPYIGFVGRIEPRKGQRELINAFLRLRRALPDARLELVGPEADASYARSVREVIRRHNAGQAITLTGEVRDVTRHLRQWDLFVSLSSDEGQGLAVLEAMAVGVPVLARPVAGITDFLADGKTGFAIARSNAGSVADHILRVWTDAAGRRTAVRQARRLVERRYAWGLTLSAFDRLYWS